MKCFHCCYVLLLERFYLLPTITGTVIKKKALQYFRDNVVPFLKVTVEHHSVDHLEKYRPSCSQNITLVSIDYQ